MGNRSYTDKQSIAKYGCVEEKEEIIETDMDEIELENFCGSIREDEPGILDISFKMMNLMNPFAKKSIIIMYVSRKQYIFGYISMLK